MVMVRYGLVAALLVLSCSSCLTVADDEGPILSVELYWDEDPRPATPDREHFEGGTCDSAEVSEMEWTLLDENGDEVQTSLSGDRDSIHRCYNAIDILGLDPGTYRLEITGYDDEGTPRWIETSGPLEVVRFDVSYSFRIFE